MASIFSKIIAGDIPCYKIAENDDFIAFLDVFPLKKGHTLVVPKKELIPVDIAAQKENKFFYFQKSLFSCSTLKVY